MKPALLTACLAFAAFDSAVAQQQVPIRTLAPALAKSTETFGAILTIRHLPGGRVLVDDGRRRRVVLLDSTLATRAVVLDSASGGAGNSYGPRPASLIPYLGDSTLFPDMTAQGLLLLDPAGQIARVLAPPRPQDLIPMGNGASATDAAGRIVFRGPIMRRPAQQPPGSSGPPTMVVTDTAVLLRADFATRQVDTIGYVRSPSGMRSQVNTAANGERTIQNIVNPLPSVDDWAVLSNGVVAIVRGIDYHVDWILPNGTTESSPKLPFDWRRLTDEDKQRLIDSVRFARENPPPNPNAPPGGLPPGAAVAGGGRGGAVRVGVGVVDGGGRGGGAGVDGPPMTPIRMETVYAALSDIVDYYPPIRPGAVRADGDGNLWILPTTSAQSLKGELVYDVVNQKGGLIYRVRIPADRSIAGFGRGGVVYLMSGSLTNGFQIERTVIAK